MNDFFAITGCSGSGKSTVCRELASKYRAVIIDADALAREAVLPGTDGLNKILSEFGNKILNTHDQLDRKALGLLVFSDPAKKKKLEQILHPAIRTLFDQKLQMCSNLKENSLVFYDIPLFFEVNYQHPNCRGVIVVNASLETCEHRIMLRDAISKQAARDRINNQIPIDEKVKKADFVINNDLNDDLAPQLEKLISWCNRLLDIKK